MNLPAPVTVQLPDIRLPDGTLTEQGFIVLEELDIVIIDQSRNKLCKAYILPCPPACQLGAASPLVLWQGEAYDAAGDYTQEQVESRVMEVLGPDIKAGIEALFVRG